MRKLVEDTSAIYFRISGVGFQLSSHPESEICAPLLKPNNVRYLGNIGVSAKLVVISVVIVVGAVSSTIGEISPDLYR